MIVDTMTHEEVYREIDRDSGNVNRWLDAHRKVIRRAILKAHRLPVCFWWEYRSPRNIQYMIGVQAYSHKIEKGALYAFIALHRGSNGLDAYTFNPRGWTEVTPEIITDHAIKRYIERTGMPKGTSMKSGLRNFMEKNFEGLYVRDHMAMGKSVRYNGEDYHAICMETGIILGKREGDIVITKTFITYDMAGGSQKEKFDEARAQMDRHPEVMRGLNKRGFLDNRA